jgi:hypothetical protein
MRRNGLLQMTTRPGIEHAQALRHVVERQGELPDPCLHASADQTGNDEEERCDGKTGGLPVRREQGKRLGHNFFGVRNGRQYCGIALPFG